MTDPLYLQVVKDYRRALDEMFVGEVTQMTVWWQRIGSSMLDDMEKLSRELAEEKAAGQVYSEGKLYKLGRYHDLLVQINDKIGGLNGQTVDMIDRYQRIYSLYGDGFANDMVKALARQPVIGSEGVDLSFNLLRSEAVENIVALARAGRPLNNILQGCTPATVEAVTRTLIQGTASGWWPRDTARKMMEDGFGAGLNRALLIARDQQIRAYREANRLGYEGLGVEEYKRMCAKQVRTCMPCIMLDGKVYKTSELMALHPQDRCSMIPVISDLTPEWQSGQEWFLEQDAATQQAMMGVGRFQMWKSGDIKLSQLVSVGDHPIWGPTLRATPLAKLPEGGYLTKVAQVWS